MIPYSDSFALILLIIQTTKKGMNELIERVTQNLWYEKTRQKEVAL